MRVRPTFAVYAAVALSWSCNPEPKSLEHVDSVGTLDVAGPTMIATATCTAFSVNLVNGSNAPVAASSDTTIALSGVGSGHAYASPEACRSGDAITSVVVPKGKDSAAFFYRTAVGERLTIAVSAQSWERGSLALQSNLFDVLGQQSVTGLDATAQTFGAQGLDVVMAHGKTLVTDYETNRVLVWNHVPAPGVSPDFALGQPSPGTTYAKPADANTLSGPAAVWSDGNRIAVADSTNCRVLIWNSWPTQSGQPAAFALGQPAGPNNLVSTTCGVSATNLSTPTGVWSDGTRFFVADTENNRVLLWNSWPTAGGQAADVVLGQPDMTTNNASSADANTMQEPGSVYATGTQLFVADTDDARVLVWNTIPTQNGQRADFALGQPHDGTNLTSSATGTTAGTFTVPVVVRCVAMARTCSSPTCRTTACSYGIKFPRRPPTRTSPWGSCRAPRT